jgi:hypothetical protein
MPDNEKESAPRWWFKNVVVPMVGSGGVFAILIAWWLGRPQAQPSPNPPSGSNAARATGTNTSAAVAAPEQKPVAYTIHMKGADASDSHRPFWSIAVYVDNKVAGVLSSDENGVSNDIQPVSTAGNHPYSIKGWFRSDKGNVNLYGDGQIYIEQGAKFDIKDENSAYMTPDGQPTLTVHLVRSDHH